MIYNGKENIHLNQYASGYCEIAEVDSPRNVILVHFSELKLKLGSEIKNPASQKSKR